MRMLWTALIITVVWNETDLHKMFGEGKVSLVTVVIAAAVVLCFEALENLSRYLERSTP